MWFTSSRQIILLHPMLEVPSICHHFLPGDFLNVPASIDRLSWWHKPLPTKAWWCRGSLEGGLPCSQFPHLLWESEGCPHLPGELSVVVFPWHLLRPMLEVPSICHHFLPRDFLNVLASIDRLSWWHKLLPTKAWWCRGSLEGGLPCSQFPHLLWESEGCPHLPGELSVVVFPWHCRQLSPSFWGVASLSFPWDPLTKLYNQGLWRCLLTFIFGSPQQPSQEGSYHWLQFWQLIQVGASSIGPLFTRFCLGVGRVAWDRLIFKPDLVMPILSPLSALSLAVPALGSSP